jgi:hypothetical protein
MYNLILVLYSKRRFNMKAKFICFMIITVFTVSGLAGQDDVWKSLRFLEGVWEGKGEGANGNSTVTQEYKFVLNGTFLWMKTRAEFKPQEKNPKGEIHEDIGFFSYDRSRKVFILRAFYVEGFVNRYVGKISDDGKTLTFDSESCENAPAGTRARLEYINKGPNEMEERFYLAWPGQELSCMTINRFKKK